MEPAPASAVASNYRLQQTVERQRGRAASAPFHCDMRRAGHVVTPPLNRGVRRMATRGTIWATTLLVLAACQDPTVESSLDATIKPTDPVYVQLLAARLERDEVPHHADATEVHYRSRDDAAVMKAFKAVISEDLPEGRTVGYEPSDVFLPYLEEALRNAGIKYEKRERNGRIWFVYESEADFQHAQRLFAALAQTEEGH